MSAKDLFFKEGHEFSHKEQKAFAREDLVYNVTEEILIALEDLGVSKKELAGRLGKSRSYVTQLLSGARNMTLGSLSDICFSLNLTPSVKITSTRDCKISKGEWYFDSPDVINFSSYHVKRKEDIFESSDEKPWGKVV